MSVRVIELRGHQTAAVDAAREAMQGGARRVIIVATTAFGKTECAAYILQEVIRRGLVVWFIVDRINLVDQTSDRLALYGIDHGIIQADNPLWAPEKNVQVVSAQTLGGRQIRQVPNLIIVDECHARNKHVQALIANTPKAWVLGLTATPFTPGMADEWDAMVNGATVNQLLRPDDKGNTYLVPLKVKACVTPEMKDAKRKRGGEYDEDEAGERGITIIGNVLETWVEQTTKHFGGPRKTIVFSPSVKHGAELCRQFAQAGYNFQQISYLDGSDDDRRAKIAEFRKPDSAIHGLVSCSVLTRGFDVPDVMVGISCKPYRKSFASHIQEMGRIMRKADEAGKTFGLWLCHSGNSVAFAEDTAWLYEYGVESLSNAAEKDTKVREPKERVKRERFCPECGTQMEPRCQACPDCGFERPARGEARIVQGELIDVTIGLGNGDAFKPRAGLRAGCLKNPKGIWNAALIYCKASSAKGDVAARRWAFGVWRGIYPDSQLPRGLYEGDPDYSRLAQDEWGIIEREVRRFRESSRGVKPGARRRRAA